MTVQDLVEISTTFVDNNQRKEANALLEDDGRMAHLVAIMATFSPENFEAEFKEWIKKHQ